MTSNDRKVSLDLIKTYLFVGEEDQLESVQYHVDRLVSREHYTLMEIVEKLGVPELLFRSKIYPQITDQEWELIFNPLGLSPLGLSDDFETMFNSI